MAGLRRIEFLNGQPVTKTEKIDAGLPGTLAAKLSSRATMADLVKDYAIFTHAILLSASPLPADPVQEAINKWEGCEVGHLDFEGQLFIGFDGNRPGFQWCNHRVFLTPHRWWADLRDFITMVGFVDNDAKEAGTAGWSCFGVPDWLHLRQCSSLPTMLPTFPLTVFTWRSNKRTVSVGSTTLAGPIPTLYAAAGGPLPEAQIFAERFFRGEHPHIPGESI